MICAETLRIPLKAKTARRIGLGITIYEKGFYFSRGKGGSKIDGGCGLTHAAFLVGNSYDSSHGELGSEEAPNLECKRGKTNAQCRKVVHFVPRGTMDGVSGGHVLRYKARRLRRILVGIICSTVPRGTYVYRKGYSDTNFPLIVPAMKGLCSDPRDHKAGLKSVLFHFADLILGESVLDQNRHSGYPHVVTKLVLQTKYPLST